MQSWFNNRRAKAVKRGESEPVKKVKGDENLTEQNFSEIFLQKINLEDKNFSTEEMKSSIKSEEPLVLTKRKNYRQRKKCPKCDFTTKRPADYKDHKKRHRKGLENPIEDVKGKTRIRKKKRFSVEQVKILESIFAIKNYPTASMRLEASVKTELSMGKVQGWFSQKRLKSGKSSTSFSQENLSKTSDDLEEEEKEVAKLVEEIGKSLNNLTDQKSNENLIQSRQHDSTLVKSEQIVPDFNSAPEKADLIETANVKTEKEKEKKRKPHMKSNHAEVLKSFFKTNKYPTKSQKRDLAKEIGFPLAKVAVWFNNQRVKDRWRGDKKKENPPKQRHGKLDEWVKKEEVVKSCNSLECDVLVGCDECN